MALHAVCDGLRGWAVYPMYPWPRLFTKTRCHASRARVYIISFLGGWSASRAWKSLEKAFTAFTLPTDAVRHGLEVVKGGPSLAFTSLHFWRWGA